MKIKTRAFTIIELLVVIAIIALLVSILLPALKEARRAGRQAVCIANLQQLGRAHHEYAADFKDFIAAFNGRREDRAISDGIHLINFPTLSSCGAQARTIVARYLDEGLPEYKPASEFMAIPVITEQHSYLVLLEYLGDRLPTPGTACPEDRSRLEWQKDPQKIIDSKGVGFADYNAMNYHWFPYSSSYQLMPAGYLRDPVRLFNFPGVPRKPFMHGAFHDRYFYQNKSEALGGNKLSDVFVPSQKVAVADSQQRHTGDDLYAGYDQARQPLLFWDSSVSVRVTRDANPGWNREKPTEPTTSASYEYKPDLMFESPALMVGTRNFSSPVMVTGRYKWTRGGLKGVDFAGGEINTRDWALVRP